MKSFLIFVVGIIGFIYSYNKYSEQKSTLKWDTVEAKMVSLKLYEYTKNYHEVPRSYTQFSPVYEYYYNKILYKSSRVSIDGMGELFTHEVEELIKTYNWGEGNKIYTYVSPSDPNFSVLIKGSKGLKKDYWIGLLIFGLFAIGALFSIIYDIVNHYFGYLFE